jgi:hypothetical protein
MKKSIPKFESEDDEREFWANADSTEHINWNKAQKTILPNLDDLVKRQNSN